MRYKYQNIEKRIERLKLDVHLLKSNIKNHPKKQNLWNVLKLREDELSEIKKSNPEFFI